MNRCFRDQGRVSVSLTPLGGSEGAGRPNGVALVTRCERTMCLALPQI